MGKGPLGTVVAALLVAAFASLQTTAAHAEAALVAVAANFTEAANQLARQFESETGHKLTISTGSTGQLHAQIKHGAPFDVFLAADDERPRKLEEEGLAVAGSRSTYAVGQLMIWCPRASADVPGRCMEEIRHDATIAIANPELAPYGRAARQVLERQGLWEKVKSRVVYGQNISQVFGLVATGNAMTGIVAKSQLEHAGEAAKGIVLAVDPNDHDPIRQDAVLLVRGMDNPAAIAFMDYLKSPGAREIIAGFGYLDGDK